MKMFFGFNWYTPKEKVAHGGKSGTCMHSKTELVRRLT